MKRKVKSASDLKRLALQTGASVEHAGGKFNTSMERAQVTRPAPPPAPVVAAPQPPAPEPNPAPLPAPASHTEHVAVNLDMQPVADAMARSNERVADVIKESLKQLSVPTKTSPPTSWLFTIKRDTRGFIESVKADPA